MSHVSYGHFLDNNKVEKILGSIYTCFIEILKEIIYL